VGKEDTEGDELGCGCGIGAITVVAISSNVWVAMTEVTLDIDDGGGGERRLVSA
jgi:hypothetical protein